MKNNPLISVIITTKNEEDVISNILESINKQTYRNFEIILIDNQSSDRTLNIAKKYTKKVFTKGPERSAQRNFGVEKARGEYVLILDADMVLTQKVLEEAVKLFKMEKEAGAVVIHAQPFVPTISPSRMH